MDLSKFKTSDWLKVGGGALFLIAGFMSWAKFEAAGVSVSGTNFSDYFLTGIIPWILIIGATVVGVLLLLGTMKPGTRPWPLIVLGATELGAILLVLRLLIGPGDGLSRGIGLILSTIGGVIAAAGAFLGFKESGGDVNTLKDVNTWKAAFVKGDSTER